MKDIIKTITKREWHFWFFVVLTVIFLTTAPLVYGWLATPQDKEFIGGSFSAINDWFVYYSYIEQARQGEILFSDLFAAEPHSPTLNIFWLAVGIVAKIFGLSNIIVFNLTRIILIPVFLFVAYLFISYLFKDIKKRKLSLLLLSFSSGLGFLLVDRMVRFPSIVFQGKFQWPLDLWVNESNTFLTFNTSPHFIASLTLFVLIFFFTILFVEKRKSIYSLWAGVAGLILFSFHPFHILPIFSVILIYFLILIKNNKKELLGLAKHYLILLIFSLPSILYYLYLLKTDFVLSQKAAQNLTFTTPLWITFFSYGLLFVFSVLAIYWLFKQSGARNIVKDKKILFIIVWTSVQFVVIYFPVNYQRRMTEGLHFPLVILTTIGLFYGYNLISKQKTKLTKFIFNQRYIVAIVLLSCFIGSTVFQLSINLFIYSKEHPLYQVDQKFIEAANWLKSIDNDKIIFNSSDYIINMVPAYSGRTVYVGHGVETPFFRIKQGEVDWFFKKNRDEQIEKDFLGKRNIDYIFYGSLEKKLGDYSPSEKQYLKKVFSNDQVSIYQVL